MDPKEKPGILKSLLSFIQYFVPSQARVYDIHAASDTLNTLRILCEGRPTEVKWRDGRSWILGEEVGWNDGTLSISGIIRGAHLSANRLIHVPDFGDYQIAKVSHLLSDLSPGTHFLQIMSAPTLRHSRAGAAAASMEIEPELLAEPDETSADSLVSSNDPDDMANEQTWPTEDELQNGNGLDDADAIPDAKVGTTPKAVRKIPKGMSEYQAAWIVDESEDEDHDDNDGIGEGEDVEMEAVEEEEMVELPDTEMETERSVAFKDLDIEEEDRQ